METLARFALSIGAFAAMLAGCGGSEPPIGARVAMLQSQTSAIATHAERDGSMAPDAAAQDLLYVSDTHTVTVYSYPKGKLEGTIRFGYLPGGQCVDKKGDVFITNTDTGQVFECAHGGKKPMAVLKSPDADPVGCSIDPTTGNLAVSSLGFGSYGSLRIYAHARGAPKIYQDPSFQQFWYCGYDSAGNLFVDGITQTGTGHDDFAFAELPKGRNALKNIALNQSIGWPGGVQWDGKYVVVSDQNIPVAYQFVIKGSNGTKAGSTSLGGSNVAGIGGFVILGHRVIAPNLCTGSYTGNVLYYRYPAGGLPMKTIANGVRYPHGLVVSKAPTYPAAQTSGSKGTEPR